MLAVATAVGSLGLAAGGTAGALIATQMTGSAASAGLPLGLLVVGSAAGAVLISRRTQQAGRTAGLILGYAVGSAGAAVVIVASVVSSFGLVLTGSAALGAANAAVFLSRYAAADVGAGAVRGRALGVVLAAAAVGAVASPNLLGPSGQLSSWLGLPRLAGLYVIAVPSFVIAGALLAALPRPSVDAYIDRLDRAKSPELRAAVRSGRVVRALLVLGTANLVMVATMAVAPVHLMTHGHDLGSVGIAVAIHVAGMFAPSPLTGWLADRVGGAAVAAVGVVLLVVAGLGAAVSSAYGGGAFVAVLALLGIGWNAGVVGGSTLLIASIPASVRPQAEGIGETAMGLAAGAGAPAAGLIVAAGGFQALAIAGAAVSALALGVLRPRASVAGHAGGSKPAPDCTTTPPSTSASTSASAKPQSVRTARLCSPGSAGGQPSTAGVRMNRGAGAGCSTPSLST
jgi:MFS family permease